MRATAATFKLGISFENWAREGRPLHPLVRPQRQADLDVRVPQFLAAQPGARRRVRAWRLLFRAAGGEGRTSSRIAAAGRDQLRLPLRCRAVRKIPAPLLRSARHQARRGQDQGSAARTGESGFIESLVLQSGAGRRRRPVHRLHRIPRAAHRADPEDRVRGLVALAAVRQRRGRADRAHRTRAAVHALDRARCGLALVHSAAASRGQWTGVQQPAYLADDEAKEELLRPSTARRSRSRACSSSRPDAAARYGTRTCVALGLCERLHRAARVDQHPPDDGRRDAAACTCFRSAASTTRWSTQYNEAVARRNGEDARLRRAALPRDQRDDSAVLAPLPATCRFPIRWRIASSCSSENALMPFRVTASCSASIRGRR